MDIVYHIMLISVPNVSFEVYAPNLWQKVLETHAVMTQVGTNYPIILTVIIRISAGIWTAAGFV